MHAEDVFSLYTSNFYSSSMLSNVATEISSCLFSLPVYLHILLRSFLGFSGSWFHQRFTSCAGRKRTSSKSLSLYKHISLYIDGKSMDRQIEPTSLCSKQHTGNKCFTCIAHLYLCLTYRN